MGPVQRVSDGFHHSSGGTVRQLGIGIEGNDVTNLLQKSGRADSQKITQFGSCLAVQVTIQLLQLSPLAFPTHPATLGLAPASLAMK